MKNIKIYTTTTCHWCHAAKEFFKEYGVGYKEIDVSTNAAAQLEMIKKSGQMGVPVADIDGQIIVGFDRQKLTKALEDEIN